MLNAPGYTSSWQPVQQTVCLPIYLPVDLSVCLSDHQIYRHTALSIFFKKFILLIFNKYLTGKIDRLITYKDYTIVVIQARNILQWRWKNYDSAKFKLKLYLFYLSLTHLSVNLRHLCEAYVVADAHADLAQSCDTHSTQKQEVKKKKTLGTCTVTIPDNGRIIWNLNL